MQLLNFRIICNVNLLVSRSLTLICALVHRYLWRDCNDSTLDYIDQWIRLYITHYSLYLSWIQWLFLGSGFKSSSLTTNRLYCKWMLWHTFQLAKIRKCWKWENVVLMICIFLKCLIFIICMYVWMDACMDWWMDWCMDGCMVWYGMVCKQWTKFIKF